MHVQPSRFSIVLPIRSNLICLIRTHCSSCEIRVSCRPTYGSLVTLMRCRLHFSFAFTAFDTIFNDVRVLRANCPTRVRHVWSLKKLLFHESRILVDYSNRRFCFFYFSVKTHAFLSVTRVYSRPFALASVAKSS